MNIWGTYESEEHKLISQKEEQMMMDELYDDDSDSEDDDRYDVRRLAHEWWNWDITPPAEYYYNVGEYIKCHPEEFKGAGPQ